MATKKPNKPAAKSTTPTNLPAVIIDNAKRADSEFFWAEFTVKDPLNVMRIPCGEDVLIPADMFRQASTNINRAVDAPQQLDEPEIIRLMQRKRLFFGDYKHGGCFKFRSLVSASEEHKKVISSYIGELERLDKSISYYLHILKKTTPDDDPDSFIAAGSLLDEYSDIVLNIIGEKSASKFCAKYGDYKREFLSYREKWSDKAIIWIAWVAIISAGSYLLFWVKLTHNWELFFWACSLIAGWFGWGYLFQRISKRIDKDPRWPFN